MRHDWLVLSLMPLTLACVRENDCENFRCFDTTDGSALADASSAGSSGNNSGAGKSGSGGAGKSGSNGDSGAGGENPGDAGTGGQGGAAGNDGGMPCLDCNDAGDGSEPAPECAATPVAGCTPSATNAFFVDASANAGDGSLASPFTTLSAALAAAPAASVTDIYLCAGTYAEAVHLDATAVNLHGGFDCTTWHYAETNVVTIAPGVAGEYALHIENVPSAVTIEDLAFEAADGDATHKSSIAAFIEGSESVTFNRAVLTAGAGVDGSSGSLDTYAAGDEWPTAEELNGNEGTTTMGGPVKGPVMCPRSDSTFGGEGGDTLPENGTAGGPIGRGGAAGTAGMVCGAGGGGLDGQPGPDGANGDGATLAGTLSASGWALTSGEDGFDGEVGGGGGGGAGAAGPASGGGGSGGAGGCGAAGSTGGQSGGSSIALLSLNSLITLNASALITADAGNGGDSVAGQAEGQNGGDYGGGDPQGCAGGNGAKGGGGGAGGGGAGGLSVAIVWRGATAPTVDTATTSATVLGQEGNAGDGGAVDNAGVTGVSQDLLEI